MQYNKALQYILGFTDYERETRYAYSPENFDLRRVEALLARLGNPHLSAPTVHIAGTKGKGSTAAMIHSILLAAGFHVGLFTSPHLLSLRERIRVNRDLIPELRLVSIVERMRPQVDAVLAQEEMFGRLTTFELIAALAFCHFAEENVVYQIIETGLGGRLDATNVVRPDVAVITSISLDHTTILGDTIQKIATEKGGIIKPGGIVVMAPQVQEAEAVITAICRERGVRLIAVGRDVTWLPGAKRHDGQGIVLNGVLGRYDVRVPLLGDHQQENAATAIAAVEALRISGSEIPASAIAQGIGQTSWPGRLQAVETMNGRPFIVVDGAHNGDSARRLCLAIQKYFRFDRLILILGTSSDKDIEGIIHELAPIVARAIVTRSVHPRSAEESAIVPMLAAHGIDTSTASSVQGALEEARSIAGPNDLILATGSLFVVAEVLQALGISV